MTKFERRFFKKLHEQNDEREAFEAELDDNTDPGEFDVDVEVDDTVVDEDPNVKAAQAVNERNEAMKEQLRGWIGRMDETINKEGRSSKDLFTDYFGSVILKSEETLIRNTNFWGSGRWGSC